MAKKPKIEVPGDNSQESNEEFEISTNEQDNPQADKNPTPKAAGKKNIVTDKAGNQTDLTHINTQKSDKKPFKSSRMKFVEGKGYIVLEPKDKG